MCDWSGLERTSVVLMHRMKMTSVPAYLQEHDFTFMFVCLDSNLTTVLYKSFTYLLIYMHIC